MRGARQQPTAVLRRGRAARMVLPRMVLRKRLRVRRVCVGVALLGASRARWRGLLLVRSVRAARRLRLMVRGLCRHHPALLRLRIQVGGGPHHAAWMAERWDFVTHGELKTFEWLRNRHRLQYYDTIEAMKQLHQSGHYVVFISHQWTSFSHGPDPSGEQYRSIVAGVSHIAQEQDWPLDMVLVWVDYSCIPQENKTMSREAIKTLPAYVTFSDAFLIASPELPHRNPTKPGEMCNLLSYRNRLLCRVEQLSFMLVNKLEHMYVTENVGEVVSASQDEKSLLEACFVFDGEATDERDKLWLVEPLLGLYAMMLAKKSQQGNAAVSHPLQRLLFERLDSEEFLSRLFPSEIVVRMVLEHGRRLEKVPPEKHTLFGDLLWRTKKLVEARLESS
mmetsp:Transcript_9084/g.28765  ORF Transcript_9084/g.28765 Transcript_9084/m.28765 type:complete len:391 (+) Transcript_9084:314-1486(+)